MFLALFSGTIFRIQCHSLVLSDTGKKSFNKTSKKWAYAWNWIFTRINKYNLVYKPILSFFYVTLVIPGKEITR